jgi:hypothetical protein
MQTLYSRPYMAKLWHKTNNNQSYTLKNWYGESRLWQKAIWLESKSLYVTKFSIELTAASITRLQYSEWYGTSKQKFKLFIFLLTNNCYKVALCTPLHAWHGHVAPRLTRFAWCQQDLHAIKLLRAHIGEWTMTRMLDYWQVMCFNGYRLKWNSWIWIPFPVDLDCTLLCTQVDKTRYSSIASGNNCSYSTAL